MKMVHAMLVFPPDGDLHPLTGKQIPLSLTTNHPLSRDGHPVLVDGDGEVLGCDEFRHMRVRLGVWIETDQPAVVCKALGAPYDEPSIVCALRRDGLVRYG